MPGQGWAFGGRGAGETMPTVGSQGMTESKETGKSNQSVARAVMILDAFAAAGGDMELGITELSEMTGLAKSVVSRVVTPLVAGGYLEQNARTRRYRVGLRMFELGLRYLRRPGAREAALMLLDELVRETGHTAYLGELDGHECVVLAAVEGSDRLRVVVSAGERWPAHVMAMGKAIMARLDDDALEEFLVGGWPHHLDGWRILSPEALREDLELTRQRGYAVTKDDGYPGVWSVGAALFTGPAAAAGARSGDARRAGKPGAANGERLMAVSVDIPAFAADEARLHELGRLLSAKTRRFVETVWNHRHPVGWGSLG